MANVKYYPPKPKVIERYALKVCAELGITSSEDIADFTELIQTLVDIKVKQMNRDVENEETKNAA